MIRPAKGSWGVQLEGKRRWLKSKLHCSQEKRRTTAKQRGKENYGDQPGLTEIFCKSTVVTREKTKILEAERRRNGNIHRSGDFYIE